MPAGLTLGSETDQREMLIARLEAATGPDRELDEAIRVLSGFDKVLLGVGDGLCATEEDYEAPDFTASVDAALMLAGDNAIIPIINEAIERCWTTPYHGNLITEDEFRKRLPAFIAAACLRAARP